MATFEAFLAEAKRYDSFREQIETPDRSYQGFRQNLDQSIALIEQARNGLASNCVATFVERVIDHLDRAGASFKDLDATGQASDDAMKRMYKKAISDMAEKDRVFRQDLRVYIQKNAQSQSPLFQTVFGDMVSEFPAPTTPQP